MLSKTCINCEKTLDYDEEREFGFCSQACYEAVMQRYEVYRKEKVNDSTLNCQ